MKKQKLVAALMSIALGTSTIFSTVAFAEGTALPDSGVEIGTTENSEVVLPEGIDWESNADSKVYYNGDYHATLVEALKAAYMDTNTTGTKEIYCKPGEDVGTMTHGHVADDLIIYGNGANVTGGEHDLEIDTYKYSRDTGLQNEAGEFLAKDITVTVKNLNGIASWGQRNTNHKITLNFENCKNMNRIYFSGTAGDIDINVNGCSFDSAKWGHKDTSIYSNANGSINVSNTTFKNIDVGLNSNHKMKGIQTIKIENCDFIDCGLGSDSSKTYAAPIRIVAQSNAESNLIVNNTKFTYSGSTTNFEGIDNGDILLGDGRISGLLATGTTTLAMTATNADVMVQKAGYHKTDGTTDPTKGTTTPVNNNQVVKPDGNNHFTVTDKEDEKPVNPPVYPSIPPTPSEPTKTEIIGSDRYETAAKIADKMGYYDTAILVNGDKSLSDGLSASSLAGKEKAPILLVKQNTIPKETLTRALKAKKIYIIGGTAAISKDVEKQLAGKEIVRVDGKNRVETSEKVAKLVGNYDEAFIVNGNTGEADAISVSSVAAKNQAPILLTNGKTSTHSKKTGVEYYVVGGDAVVSDSIVSEFDAERISGSDRYETNRAVIKEFYPNKNKYYYTKGDLLVDALAVSPLSKDNGVVLVSPKSDNSILKDKDLVQVGGMDFEINLK
ncbi:cell wall-binding repeat-containing protein [Peptacetobacter hiranonis]|uniref:cell wall-binding repeat-containing protein n=1 Tax=Peptacetobacter hiranonis TaxID=89152 RepID=UPI0019175325|nr:cell wall-binding repeat-containing protein [Peptacetobacter hiranonis]QQQ87611.1 cell wall-binding repeat-containing protein [Peptacetobacter hiranonis]